VSFQGRVHIRTGPRRGIASRQDERILNEKRRHRDKPFDAHPIPSARIADLDRRLFEEEYLARAVAPDVLAANERTYEERLAATKMISSADDGTPTVMGLLTLGVRVRDFLPGAYVQFLRVADTKLSDRITDESVIDGPIGQVIRILDEKMRAHTRLAVEVGAGDVERRHSDYPISALQQLTRNALLHRMYQDTHAPVRITWYDDHIEIVSPGGPFGVVSRENFGEPGVTDYQNPNLAEALRVLGFVQRFGFGIQQARRDLESNRNGALAFDVQPHLIFCRVSRSAP
jgi:ATP-dependent DNA helicase RecG